jgi:two-component system sensor histidine kinase DesK
VTSTISDHRRRKLGWTPYAWLIYLVFYIAAPAFNNGTWRDWAWTLGTVAVFLPLYFAGFRTSGRRLLVIAWIIHGLGLAAVAVNPGGSCFFIYAAAFLGFTGPPPKALRWLGAMLLVTGIEAYLLPWPIWVWIPAIVVSAVVGATNIHFAEMHRKDAHLRVAQQAVEEMARVAERERIGRDLHDLLGHTLSVIVLKSELASRLADREPARAVTEIREVERISREALAEVRKAVRGYRSESLLDEVANAERVLVAAGIAAEIDVHPQALPPDEDRALAYALREAVTNVVRHAQATRCSIRLTETGGRTRLEVLDDGRGGLAPEGSGLSGMRERLRQVAGTLERDGAHGTRLVMSLPSGPAS